MSDVLGVVYVAFFVAGIVLTTFDVLSIRSSVVWKVVPLAGALIAICNYFGGFILCIRILRASSVD